MASKQSDQVSRDRIITSHSVQGWTDVGKQITRDWADSAGLIAADDHARNTKIICPCVDCGDST